MSIDVAAAPDLPVDRQPAANEFSPTACSNGDSARRRRIDAAASGNVRGPRLGVVEECPQQLRPFGAGAGQVDVPAVIDETTVIAIAGAGDRDVQPPLAALRGSAGRTASRPCPLVRARTDAQEDHVALVALDVLQVLDEERLFADPRRRTIPSSMGPGGAALPVRPGCGPAAAG